MNQSELNRTSYNQIADQWAAVRDNSPINTCIRTFCKLLPANARILDIGCGTGRPIDAYLSRKGYSVVGIDSSERMIQAALACQLPNATFLVGDFMDFTAPEPFDAVIAFDSLWHIEESKQACLYPSVSSLLRPNGYFLFTHGKRRGTVRGTMFAHQFAYSALDAEEVKKLLQENSMDIISWQEEYSKATTGTRDLLVVAKRR